MHIGHFVYIKNMLATYFKTAYISPGASRDLYRMLRTKGLTIQNIEGTHMDPQIASLKLQIWCV